MAHADDRQACADAYAATQTLRQDEKLQEAHEQALACARDVCKDFERSDCSKWLTEIESIQPTVVFEVHDATGHAATDVRVTLDGKPWLSSLRTSPVPLDPGSHKLQFQKDGAKPIDVTVEVHDGDKGKKISATFEKPAVAAPLSDNPIPPAPPPPAMGPQKIAGIIVMSSSAIGVILAGVFGAKAKGEYNTLHAACPSQMNCSPSLASDRSSYYADSGAFAGSLVGAGVLLGTGLVVFLTAPKAPHNETGAIRPIIGLNLVGIDGSFQ